MLRCAVAVLVCAAVSLVEPVRAQDARRGMTPADQFAVTDLGETRISPDGTTIVYTVSATDLDANRISSRVMKIAAVGGASAELTDVPSDASNIRWSPDSSRIAFFASRDGKSAVWTYNLASGTLTRVADYDRTNRFVSKTGNALAWSPDGSQLAFVGTIEPPPGTRDPLIVSRLQYKTRTSYSDDRWTQLFLVNAKGGTPKQLTRDETDHHSIDWTAGPDIVFLKNPESDPDARHNYDIYAIEATTGHERRLTETPGVEMDPHISPDGRWIAYTATTRPVTTIDSVAEDTHVWVMAHHGGEAREINHALDRRSSSPEWAPDSHAVYYLAADHGKTVLYRAPAMGGVSVAVIDRKAQVGPYSIAKDGLVALGISDPATPRDLYRLRPDGQPEPLTWLNTAVLKRWKLVAPETMTFHTADGLEVEGWYYPALQLNGGKPGPASTPLILSVHGGPHGMYGYGFNAGFQINAAHGYATLAINPRGSSGYGQSFADGCVMNWGGGDYEDLMAGVDHVLKVKAEIDGSRLGVMGGSYGGFMTNWIVTQTTRFRAAVSSASVSNLISFYATSLYQDLVHTEFNGFPWEHGNFDLLWKWSPLAHIADATTPMLLIHGEADNDVHITQAEEMYTALRRHGVDAVLARYPREGHGFREPKHNLDRTERTLAWFDRFLITGKISRP